MGSHARYRSFRFAAIRKYGGKCSRCGFDDWRALQFDHVNGSGGCERKLQAKNSGSYYEVILSDKTGSFQLLCANCNCIKRHEKQEAVGDRHQTEILAAMKKFRDEQKTLMTEVEYAEPIT